MEEVFGLAVLFGLLAFARPGLARRDLGKVLMMHARVVPRPFRGHARGSVPAERLVHGRGFDPRHVLRRVQPEAQSIARASRVCVLLRERIEHFRCRRIGIAI